MRAGIGSKVSSPLASTWVGKKNPSVSGKTSKAIAGTAFCTCRTQSRVFGEQRERNAWRYSLARHCRGNHKVQSVLLVHILHPQGAEQPPSCPTSGRGPLLLELEHNSYELLRITHFFKKYTQVLVSCCWNLSQHAEPFFLPDTSWFIGSCTLFLHSRVLPTLFQHCMPTANWRYKGLSSFRETKSKAANIITPPPTVVGEKKKKRERKMKLRSRTGFSGWVKYEQNKVA